jgi:hypothetical protein
MSSPAITRNKRGQFQRDDSQLRDGIIELIEQVRLIGCAWEMFPEIKNRREYMDPIYTKLAKLVEQLKQVDEPKGATHDG